MVHRTWVDPSFGAADVGRVSCRNTWPLISVRGPDDGVAGDSSRCDVGEFSDVGAVCR